MASDLQIINRNLLKVNLLKVYSNKLRYVKYCNVF